MVISEVATLMLYAISMVFLPEYFGTSSGDYAVLVYFADDKNFLLDLHFVLSVRFAWKVAVIVAVSSLPLYVIKLIKSRVSPAVYSKLS